MAPVSPLGPGVPVQAVRSRALERISTASLESMAKPPFIWDAYVRPNTRASRTRTVTGHLLPVGARRRCATAFVYFQAPWRSAGWTPMGSGRAERHCIEAAPCGSGTVWKRHRMEAAPCGSLAASAPEVPSNPSLQRARSARRRSSTPFPSVRSGVLTWNPPPSLCVQIDIRVVPCRSGKKGVMPVRTPIRQRPVSPARITGDFPDTRPSPLPESSARDACPLSVGSDPRVARDVFQTRIG